jgi:hypothetical protein
MCPSRAFSPSARPGRAKRGAFGLQALPRVWPPAVRLSLAAYKRRGGLLGSSRPRMAAILLTVPVQRAGGPPARRLRRALAKPTPIFFPPCKSGGPPA